MSFTDLTQGTVLPVEDVLDELRACLSAGNEVILQAPPGAGKTTLVPLALKDETWLTGKKTLMLEPRRIAARSAAYRLASLLGESPGETVGYRMRLDTNVSKDTRIEVITEGILTRMLQDDPSLEDVGLVIFDEFHERSLDSDLALSLCLKGRSLFRGPDNELKILVMSATLDSTKVAALLDDAPIVSSDGKQYPIEVLYGRASQPRERITDRSMATITKALQENPDSSILVFLPGQGEIIRTTDALTDWLATSKLHGVHLYPLYGNLSIEEQQMAIAPLLPEQSARGERKVVIATNVAETSLTIEGIDVVVDSGLVREPVFDPATGMTRLQTGKVSKASSIQRMGRAGRLRPGRCYRLWSASQQEQLAPHATAEILSADLAPLALQLLQWGVDDPAELSWMDPPPAGPWSQAIELLTALGAIESTADNLTLTPHGEAMTALAVHPRLAHLLICAVDVGETELASLLAAVLSDRDPFGQENPDITYPIAILSGEVSCPSKYRGWQRRTNQLARQFAEQIRWLNLPTAGNASLSQEQATGYLLACAYPDRIARRRHSSGFQLANGRSAALAVQHSLARAPWLAVAEVGGVARSKGDKIRSAAELDPTLFDTRLSSLLTVETVADWEKKSNRFVAEQRKVIGALVVQRQKLDKVPADAKRRTLLEHIEAQGLSLLPWSPTLLQWQARVLLVKSVSEDTSWPDVSDDGLLATLAQWLGSYLDNVSKPADFKRLDLKKALAAMLPWDKRELLDKLVPEKLQVPSGSNIAIDYTRSPPVLAVKLQEMFGCEESPRVANDKVPLSVHLLSPAGRPLQVTQDLAGFWRTSYHEVKREMKGRYPKHPWPDDPLLAVATKKTKGR